MFIDYSAARLGPGRPRIGVLFRLRCIHSVSHAEERTQLATNEDSTSWSVAKSLQEFLSGQSLRLGLSLWWLCGELSGTYLAWL